MCCGRPVIATEVGGVVDLMGRRQQVDGFSVWDHGVTAPSGDVEAFTRGLAFLLARGEGTEQAVPVNLPELLEDVVESAQRNGSNVTLRTKGPMRVTIRRRPSVSTISAFSLSVMAPPQS